MNPKDHKIYDECPTAHDPAIPSIWLQAAPKNIVFCTCDLHNSFPRVESIGSASVRVQSQ